MSSLPSIVNRLHAPDVLGLLSILALGGALAWLASVFAVRRALTRPPRRTAAWAVSKSLAADPAELDVARYGTGPRPFRTWTLDHAGHRCPVWEIDADNPAGPVAILTHGWNDSKIGGLARLAPFLPHSSRILIWDMPGHGEANGRTHLGLIEPDLLRELIARADRDVVLFGWSLGAGVSLAAAVAWNPSSEGRGRGGVDSTVDAEPAPHQGPGLPPNAQSPMPNARILGVILEAPYRLPQTPAQRVMAARGIPPGPRGLGLLSAALTTVGGRAWQREHNPFDRAALASRVGALGIPLSIIHGSLDPVCPIDDARAIAAAHGSADLTEIDGARHNDLWLNPDFRAQSQAAAERSLARWSRRPSTAQAT